MTYIGGKSSIAHIVWDALGDVAHFLEPFFGSGAVLLKRPADHKRCMETVNDKDGHLANVWRSLQYDPDEVAKWCDWPVNHADLQARKQRLIKEQDELLNKLVADDMYFNAKLAGYWIWCASCWIGAGMLSPGQRPNVGDDKGVHSKRPNISGAWGMPGIHAKCPHICHEGKGINKNDICGRISLLGNSSGCHSKTKYNPANLPMESVQDPYKPELYTWFRLLSERLRKVRVVCGDWSRICGGDWQDNGGTCGYFFDPPYSEAAGRTKQIYQYDDLYVAHEVAKWCLERGKRETYRIVLAGYYEEHEWLLEHGWRVHRWHAQGGYGNKGDGKGRINKKREALFMSPHCLQPQPELF